MQYRPPSPENTSIEKQVEGILKEYFPHHQTLTKEAKEEFDHIKKLVTEHVKQAMDPRQNNHPIHPNDVKLYIKDTIINNIFEKEFEKTIKLYTKNLGPEEQKKLKQDIKKDMDEIHKKGIDLIKNPKAHEIMIKLLVLKHCPQNKLKVDPTIETQNNISKLKMEYMKLLKELELDKKNLKLVQELKEFMKDIFLKLDKKIDSQQQPKDELSLFFKLLINLSDPPQGKEFEKLTSEQQVKIVTQGSEDGRYRTTPNTAIPMPDNILIFPNTPAALEKDHSATSPGDTKEKSETSQRSLPTPFSTKPKPPSEKS